MAALAYDSNTFDHVNPAAADLDQQQWEAYSDEPLYGTAQAGAFSSPAGSSYDYDYDYNSDASSSYSHESRNHDYFNRYDSFEGYSSVSEVGSDYSPSLSHNGSPSFEPAELNFAVSSMNLVSPDQQHQQHQQQLFDNFDRRTKIDFSLNTGSHSQLLAAPPANSTFQDMLTSPVFLEGSKVFVSKLDVSAPAIQLIAPSPLDKRLNFEEFDRFVARTNADIKLENDDSSPEEEESFLQEHFRRASESDTHTFPSRGNSPSASPHLGPRRKSIPPYASSMINMNLAPPKPRKLKQNSPFKCQFPGCEKTFTRPYNLKSHMRTHTAERPYPCPFPGCDKTFSRQHDRNRHAKLHLGIKPYVCRNCQKAFARQDALNRHLRVENGPCSIAVGLHNDRGHDHDHDHDLSPQFKPVHM